ncbi:alanine dehydrogenase [Streptococcus pneumoniae]|nr:alanine dehydrogenase/PNT, N-terminal domain protein [Streptococcus pneumoniae GA13224]MBT1060511.1 alanine dehydrogenase [Streptococcus pneumoniae]CEO75849.1 alanine dehydrogenase [Streptococcus pneumoniae]CEW33012.1 alanine dehydrogenase [Streptococcus pneumoniae]CGE93376.1 alanine dehydrogenase [Streptococcus pneumoniae]
MLIGIPKEIKNNENRVALTPAGVHSLVSRGHRVLIETNAGLGSGFTDADYQKQGQLPLLVPMSEVAGRMAV